MSDYNRDLGILSTYSLTLTHPNFISAYLRIFLPPPLSSCIQVQVICDFVSQDNSNHVRYAGFMCEANSAHRMAGGGEIQNYVSVKLTQLLFEDYIAVCDAVYFVM